MSDKYRFEYVGLGPSAIEETNDSQRIEELKEAEDWELFQGPTEIDASGNGEIAEVEELAAKQLHKRAERTGKEYWADVAEDIDPSASEGEEITAEEAMAEMEAEWEEMSRQKRIERRKQAVDRQLDDRDWLQEEKRRKSVAELSGQEFVDLLQEASEDQATDKEVLREELYEEIEAEEREMPDAPKPDEILEAQLEAADQLEQRADRTGKEYWAVVAEEMREEAEEDKRSASVIHDDESATLATKNSLVIEEMRALDSVEIIDEKDGVVEAHVPDINEIGGE